MAFSNMDWSSNIEKISFDPATEKVTGRQSMVTQGTKRFLAPAPSPDNNWVAFTSWAMQEDLYVVRPDGSEMRELTDDISKDRVPKWTSNSKQIVFQSNRGSDWYEIWSIQPDGSNLQQITTQLEKAGYSGFWYPLPSHDGSQFVAGNEIGSYIVDLRKGLPAKDAMPLPPPDKNTRFLANSWSPDGRWLAGTRWGNQGAPIYGIAVYSFESGKYEQLTNFGRSPTWLSDSRRLLFASDPGYDKIFILDTVTKKWQEILTVPQGSYIDSPSPSSDDRSIYFEHGANGSEHLAPYIQVD